MIHDKLVRAAEDQKALLNEILVSHSEAFQDFSRQVVRAFNNDGRLLVAGSGTLGAVANLVANFFSHRLTIERPALPALSLCQNPLLSTALAVDGQSEQYLSRQMKAVAAEGDVLLAFDDARHDPAVREALQLASSRGLTTARVLLGTDDAGSVAPDYLFCFAQVPPARGIEGAVFFGSLLCEMVEGELFGF